MELVFGVVFFVLPLIGMLITVLTAGFEKNRFEGSKSLRRNSYISGTSKAAYAPRGTVKIEKRYAKHFFKKANLLRIGSRGILDTS